MSAPAAERPLAPFGVRATRVIARSEIGPYVVLTALDAIGPRPLAGQFYMLRTTERWGGGEDGRPFLPRALSFARVTEVDGGLALDFLFERVGPGTERLAEAALDDELMLTGPFGNGFAPDASRRPLLVAGGIGLAPIVAIGDRLRELGGPPAAMLVGMRSAEHAAATAHYGLECSLATDDGSAGHHGFVTELLARSLESDAQSTVYACGPPPMLEAVRALCAERGVPSQLALESGMACGFGACYGCVVPTREGFLRLCVDGPVLDGDALETADFPGAQ